MPLLACNVILSINFTYSYKHVPIDSLTNCIVNCCLTGAQEDVKQFLSLQQKSMAHLLDTARKDLAALNIIEEGMAKLVRA